MSAARRPDRDRTPPKKCPVGRGPDTDRTPASAGGPNRPETPIKTADTATGHLSGDSTGQSSLTTTGQTPPSLEGVCPVVR